MRAARAATAMARDFVGAVARNARQPQTPAAHSGRRLPRPLVDSASRAFLSFRVTEETFHPANAGRCH
jgi:hypothetical protein